MTVNTDGLAKALWQRDETELYAQLERATEYAQEWKGRYDKQTEELCRLNLQVWRLHHCLSLVKSEAFATAVRDGGAVADHRSPEGQSARDNASVCDDAAKWQR